MYVTNKAQITTALNTAGYKEHLNGVTEDQMANLGHKVYLLTPIGISLEGITSNSIRESDLVELAIVYVNADTTKKDANFDLFRTAIETVRGQTGYVAGFEGDATFTQLGNDPNKSLGKVSFYLGYRTC